MNSLKITGVADLERVKTRARKLAALQRLTDEDAGTVVRDVDRLIGKIQEMEEVEVTYGEA